MTFRVSPGTDYLHLAACAEARGMHDAAREWRNKHKLYSDFEERYPNHEIKDSYASGKFVKKLVSGK